MVPALDDGGSGPGGVALQFVMRDMGNGVQRLEDPIIVPEGWPGPSPEQEVNAVPLSSPLAGPILDMAQTALCVLKDKALGYVLAAPIRGFAVYLAEGVTQVTIKLSCVIGDLNAVAGLMVVPC